MAEELYKKRMIGLNVIRKKVKELDKRISGMDDPIKKAKLSKQRDKAIGRIDSRLKMKNFGFGTKAGVTKKRNEFLKTGKMPKTISGSIVGFTKKLGGIEGKKVGGPVDRIIKKPKKAGLKPKAKPPKMSREVQARERSRANLQSDLMDERLRLRKKFTGRGTAGSAQFRKEMAELTSKMQKKFDIDQDLAKKYGKDAYKSRAFGLSPIADKNKSRKTLPKKRQGFVGRKAEEMKKRMTKMRGGGLARSGSASLSGFKVR
jgi:hypothetical protein